MSGNKLRLCFIGFGEAGQAIASGLREAGVEQIAAWDTLFPEMQAHGCARQERRSARGSPVRPPMRSSTPTSSFRR